MVKQRHIAKNIKANFPPVLRTEEDEDDERIGQISTSRFVYDERET